MGPRKHVLDGVDSPPMERGNVGGYMAKWKALGVSGAVYAAKAIMSASYFSTVRSLMLYIEENLSF